MRRGFARLALAAAVVAAAPLLSAAARARSFSIDSLKTTATLNADGSMDVVEAVTYRFEGGPFHEGTRSFQRDWLDEISGFGARRDGTELAVKAPPASDLDGYAWDLGGEVSDETATYELRYHVDGAVKAADDVAWLYWQFLGDDHPGVGDVQVTVKLPTDAPVAPAGDTERTDVIRAFAHGPRNGVVQPSPGAVDLSVADVPAKTFVEARIVMPAGAVDVPSVGGTRLASILAEEAEYQAEPEQNAGRRRIGQVLSALAPLTGLGIVLRQWRRYGREPRVDPLVGEYWREPLDDPPAVVQQLMGGGGGTRGIAATLVDLAQRGHLHITETRREHFGPDEVHHVYDRTESDEPLTDFERSVMDFIFAGQPSVTGEQIADRATADRTATNAFVTAFDTQVKAAHDAKGYGHVSVPKGQMRTLALVSGGCVLVGIVALVLGSAAGIATMIGGVALFGFGANALRNRNQATADALAKAKGLKKYLEDFSNLEEAPAGHLILWERFLVYAVGFGVARQLLNGMAAKLPHLVEDPKFGDFYNGPGGIHGIPEFPGAFESTAGKAISPPSSSGSGGGFSGGGGGGGGGGGFGAR